MKELIQNYVICYLQQDDSRRHLFRVRPLFAWDEQGIDLVEGAETRFMLDGYIRVIPDKQEQLQFVARMTAMRSLCALDLRGVTQEFSKIRSNKYYTEGGVDDNAFVVYSDVVKALPVGLVAQVFTSHETPGDEWILPPESTLGVNLALIRFGGVFHGPYYPTENGSSLKAAENRIAYTPTSADISRCLTIACDDFEADIFLDLTSFGLSAECPTDATPAQIIRPLETSEVPIEPPLMPPQDTVPTLQPLRQRRSIDERWRQSAQRHMGAEHSAQDEVLRTKIAVTRLFNNAETHTQLVGMLASVPGLLGELKHVAPSTEDDAITGIAERLNNLRVMQDTIALQYAEIADCINNFR